MEDHIRNTSIFQCLKHVTTSRMLDIYILKGLALLCIYFDIYNFMHGSNFINIPQSGHFIPDW